MCLSLGAGLVGCGDGGAWGRTPGSESLGLGWVKRGIVRGSLLVPILICAVLLNYVLSGTSVCIPEE